MEQVFCKAGEAIFVFRGWASYPEECGNCTCTDCEYREAAMKQYAEEAEADGNQHQ